MNAAGGAHVPESKHAILGACGQLPLPRAHCETVQEVGVALEGVYASANQGQNVIELHEEGQIFFVGKHPMSDHFFPPAACTFAPSGPRHTRCRRLMPNRAFPSKRQWKEPMSQRLARRHCAAVTGTDFAAVVLALAPAHSE